PAAAAGSHFAPDPLVGEVLAGENMLGGDFLPVALELLRDELREAGQGALPHLGARDAHHASVVGPHHDPGVDFAPGLALRDSFADGERDPEGEPAARCGGTDDEPAAGRIRDVRSHGPPPQDFFVVSAAMCTAARMRW